MSNLNRVLFPWTHKDAFTIRDAAEGCLITGGIGSSKTSGSGAIIAKNFLENGMGGLVLTAKPSELTLWQKYAKAYGREDDLIIFGEGSDHQFNFLDFESNIRQDSGKGIVQNVVDVLTTVIKASDTEHGKNEEFWSKSLNQLLINSINLCLLATDKIRFEDLYKITQSAPKKEQQRDSHKWQQQSLCYQMLTHSANRLNSMPESPELEKKVRKLYKCEDYFLEIWCNLAEKTRSIVEQIFFSSFADLLMDDPLYDLFNKGTTITPEDTTKGKIIIVNLPVLVYEGVGRTAQLLWKYVWQRTMLRRKIKEKSRPTFLWADEAQYFLHEHDVKYQSTCREYRACTVYITQNLPNFYLQSGGGETGKMRFRALAGNLATKIFHANSDIETNEYAADLIGKDWGWSQNEGYSTGEKSSFSHGQTESLNYKIDPSQFTKLKRGGPENNFYTQVIVHRSGAPFQFIEDGKIIYENYVNINIKQTLL